MLRIRIFILSLVLIGLNSASLLAANTPFFIEVDRTATEGGNWVEIGSSVNTGGLDMISGPVGLGIEEAGLADLTDAYNGSKDMAIDGLLFANPDGDVDSISNVSGKAMTSVSDIVSSLDINMQYLFNATTPTVRILATFTDAKAFTISATVRYGWNVVSNGDTDIVAKSSGNTTLDASNRLSISNDKEPSGGDPANTFIYYGSGNPSVSPMSVVNFDNEELSADYNIKVASGTSQSLMWFSAMDLKRAGTQSLVSRFKSSVGLMASGLFDELDNSDLDMIFNWDLEPSSPPVPTPGTLVLSGFGIGLVTWIRRLRIL